MGDFIGLGGTMFMNTMSLGENQVNRNYNRDEAQRNRTWQTGERLDSQQYQERMFNKATQFQRAFQAAQNQFTQGQVNQEREYNTPYAQAMRLNQIGLSPNGQQMSAADSTFGVPQGVSVPSAPGAPSGGVASSPPPNNLGIELGRLLMTGLQSVGAFTKDISQSDLNDAEKDRIYSLLQGQLTSQELQNRIQSVNATIAENTGLKKAWQDLEKGYADILLLKGKEYEAQMSALAKKSEAFLNDAKTILTGEQYSQLVIDVFNAQRRYDDLHMLANSENMANRASAYASYQSGAKSAAETKTIAESRPSILKQLSLNVDKSIRDIRSIDISNTKAILETCDKAFGFDTGIGSYIKTILLGATQDERRQFLDGLIKELDKSKPKVK